MSIHQHKKLTEEDPRPTRHLSGGKTVIIAGIGVAALIGLAVVFSAVTGSRNNVTSPYGQEAGQLQETPAVPPVRNP
jgi:hypothetical protein